MELAPRFKKRTYIDRTEEEYVGYKLMHYNHSKVIVQCIIPAGSKLVMPEKNKYRTNKIVYVAAWKISSKELIPMLDKALTPYIRTHEAACAPYKVLTEKEFVTDSHRMCSRGFYFSRTLEDLKSFLISLHCRDSDAGLISKWKYRGKYELC